MRSSIDFAVLEGRLRQHVAALARTPRTPGSAEHRQAATYIRQRLEQTGYSVVDAEFDGAGLAALNLLTEPLPNLAGLPLFVVGAHYDSIPGSPGADDNASGVAALLELAGLLLADLQDAGALAALQLVAYDLEEYGLLGSYTHSQELQRSQTPIHGMISLEMLAYTNHQPYSQRLPPQLSKLYPQVGNFIGVCGNEASNSLAQTVTQAMKSIPGLPVESLAVPGNGELLPETRQSDHSSFWDHGFQALMITDTSFFRNPHYHQPSDTPDTLDYPFLAKVTAGVGEAVSRLLRG